MSLSFGEQAGNAIGMGTAAALPGSILGIALGAYNDNRQEIQNRRLMNQQIGAQEQLTDYNYKKQLQMWNDTNYSAQMDQLKKAGLNPALLYGMGGGGGQSNNIEPGHVETGKAEQNPGEVQAMAGMGIQGAIAASQIALNQAQARNLDADTQNKPKTGANIEASTKKLQADTGNVEMDTALKGVQVELANFDAAITNATMEDVISQAHSTAQKLHEEVTQAGVKTHLDQATVETKIKQVEQDLLNTVAQKALTQAQTKLTGAQQGLTEAETAQINQEMSMFIEKITSEINLNKANTEAVTEQSLAAMVQAQVQASRLRWDKKMHNVKDSTRLIVENVMDVVGKAAQAIILKKLLPGAPPVIKGFRQNR